MRQKSFYYTGKTYQNATYTETYKRESRWMRIDYTPTENARPFFRHYGKRYYLDDFIRIGYPDSHTTEIKAADGETVTLCGHEADQYYKPLFIELDDAGEAARLYRYEGSETDYT